MDKIYASHNWLPVQRKWLERLAKQLVHEVIIDRDFVNSRFADYSGAKQLDKIKAKSKNQRKIKEKIKGVKALIV